MLGRRLAEDPRLRMMIGAAPLFFAAWMLYMKIALKDDYAAMVGEDTILEYAQSLVYLVASLLAIDVTVSFYRRRRFLFGTSYLVLGMGLFFVAMEEVSWGHSLLHLRLPDYFRAHNIQGDLTIHNLDAVQPHLHDAYILVGLYGAFAHLLLPGSVRRRHGSWVCLVLPDAFLALYFFPVFAIYFFFQYGSPFAVQTLGLKELDITFDVHRTFIVFKDQEPAELLLSLGFFFFVLLNRYRVRVRQPPGSA